MVKLLIDGVEYSVPDEDDFELEELAQLSKLRDEFGDIGSTIAMVWIVKRRVDPSFTVEQAKRIKISQISERDEADGDPLPMPDQPELGSSGSNSESSTVPSAIPVGSGIQ